MLVGADGSHWGGDVTLPSDEVHAILRGLDDPTRFTSTRPTLRGAECVVTHAEKNLVILQKDEVVALFRRCKTCVVACLFSTRDTSLGKAFTATEKLAQHLLALGY
jgi:hypothetical protein